MTCSGTGQIMEVMSDVTCAFICPVCHCVFDQFASSAELVEVPTRGICPSHHGEIRTIEHRVSTERYYAIIEADLQALCDQELEREFDAMLNGESGNHGVV